MEQRRDRVRAFRSFNRLYTRQVGLLDPNHRGTECSLVEARLLFEISRRRGPTAALLCDELQLDRGQASRVLAGLQRRGLIGRKRSATDHRERILSRTKEGKRVLALLKRRTNAYIGSILSGLSEQQQQRLIESMATIERLLWGTGEDGVELRSHGPGDIGWAIQRHGELYAREWGFDSRFEAEVATGLARFGASCDPTCERLWIAEGAGQRLGCAAIVRAGKRLGQFRWFLLEPELRGRGAGRRMLDESIKFASSSGYRRVFLLTQHVLEPARSLYESAGFERVSSELNRRWGVTLREERWERSIER